jgi:hypothetical protein
MYAMSRGNPNSMMNGVRSSSQPGVFVPPKDWANAPEFIPQSYNNYATPGPSSSSTSSRPIGNGNEWTNNGNNGLIPSSVAGVSVPFGVHHPPLYMSYSNALRMIYNNGNNGGFGPPPGQGSLNLQILT